MSFFALNWTSFANVNKKTLTAIKVVLFGTAVIRPAITIVLLGAPAVAHEITAQAAIHTAQEAAYQAAIHLGQEAATQAAANAGKETAAQLATHTMTYVAGEVAAGAAVAVGGDVAVAEGGKAGVRALIRRIIMGFYEERAKLLAAIVSESLVGGKLRRIKRLAELQHAAALQSARQIVAELRNLRG